MKNNSSSCTSQSHRQRPRPWRLQLDAALDIRHEAGHPRGRRRRLLPSRRRHRQPQRREGDVRTDTDFLAASFSLSVCPQLTPLLFYRYGAACFCLAVTVSYFVYEALDKQDAL